MATTEDDAKLWAAYRSTSYQALDRDEVLWTVRLGKIAPRPGPMAYITSDNPGSRQLSARANQQRRSAFRERLQRQEHRFLDGRSIDDEGIWPDEQGFWVLSTTPEEARRLGSALGQRAVLFVDADGQVSLQACERSDNRL